MPLGSAAKSTIDIDFTRAQGVNSSGQISFEPPRTRVGTTMVSPYKVLVPVINGIATVDLVRLPTGTYHVRENIDGRAPYEFNFALPTSAAATIQYEDIAPVDPVPLVYTTVRTVNGVPPDPTTGNINIASGGDPIGLNDLTDVTMDSLINGQSIVYDALSSQWKNLALTAWDVGASPTGHTHSSSQITDFQSAVDARVQLIVDAAPSALDTLNELAAALGDDPDFAGSVTLALTNKQPLDSDLTTIAGLSPTNLDVLQRVGGAWANRTPAQLKTDLSLTKSDVGLQNVDNTSDLSKPVSTDTAASIALRAMPNRILRVKDRTKQGSGDTYNLPNTASAWALWAVGPMEYTIEASVGDDISLDYDFMMQIHVSCFFDFVVVTGGTPTIQRYLASGDTTPTFNGPSGSYPSNDQFQGIKGTLGFQAQSGDIEAGIIRLRWVIKTSVDTGKIYANNNYPLSVTVVNTRLSGL
jgi:hypothetical protein